MGDVRKFESAWERDVNSFFENVAETLEWAEELIFISHREGGDLVVGILGKDAESSRSTTYLLGILQKALLSTALDSIEE